jgi:hypothetical protein
MPAGYVHAAQTLFAYGRTYFDKHQEKDASHLSLGRAHRSVNHDWHHAYGTFWDFEDPTPEWIARTIEWIADDQGDEAAEIYQATFLSHDYPDRLQDGVSPTEQKLCAVRCIFLLRHPEILESKFGVDVIRGRIHRVIDGQDMWESSAETIRDYERLRRYVEKVLQNDPEMQNILAAFEKQYRTLLRTGEWKER